MNLYSIKCLELTTTKPSCSAFLLCVAYCTAGAQSCSACQSDSETHPINLKLGSEMFQNDTCFIMQQWALIFLVLLLQCSPEPQVLPTGALHFLPAVGPLIVYPMETLWTTVKTLECLQLEKPCPVCVLRVLIVTSSTAGILQWDSSAHAGIEFQLELAPITTEQCSLLSCSETKEESEEFLLFFKPVF